MRRIFFDENGRTESGYWLLYENSLADLAQIENKHDGMRVTLYMPDELELEAELFYDTSREVWIGRPIEGTVRLLDNQS